MVELHIDRIAGGGEGVARDADGRVVFVRGALPGETVDATVTDEKKSFARARVRKVLDPVAERVAPPCDHVGEGCGGCDFQHATVDYQRKLKVQMVTEQLERIGKVDQPVVHAAGPLPDTGYRTTVRCVISEGRAGFRQHHAHAAVEVDSCMVAHPLVEELMVEGWFGETPEVTIRAGAATGERIVVAHPRATDIRVPDDVVLTSTNQLKRGSRVWYHEEVAGRSFRISARSFFQTSPQGAEALVNTVSAAAAPFLVDDASLADLYSGVGLFAATLPATGPIIAVESNKSSVVDAGFNLAHREPEVQLVRSKVEQWSPKPVDMVVADPSRKGLGKDAIGRIDATGATALVLVSCDAGALGRDAHLLGIKGFTLESSTLVDLFPHTSHVEVVSTFKR